MIVEQCKLMIADIELWKEEDIPYSYDFERITDKVLVMDDIDNEYPQDEEVQYTIEEWCAVIIDKVVS